MHLLKMIFLWHNEEMIHWFGRKQRNDIYYHQKYICKTYFIQFINIINCYCY